tara:strand:- start:1182 stop:1406 length:225 start_codon:yes stop_codon:yes gene_type:complete
MLAINLRKKLWKATLKKSEKHIASDPWRAVYRLVHLEVGAPCIGVYFDVVDGAREKGLTTWRACKHHIKENNRG